MAQSSGWFVYAPGSSATFVRSPRASRRWGSLRRTGGFRTTQLNVVGWTAVLGPGVVAGFAVGVLRGRRTVAMAVGVVSAWSLALIVDRLMWRRSGFSVDVTDLGDADLLAAQVALDQDGIDHDIEEQLFEDDVQHRYLHSTVKHHDEILDTLHRYRMTKPPR